MIVAQDTDCIGPMGEPVRYLVVTNGLQQFELTYTPGALPGHRWGRVYNLSTMRWCKAGSKRSDAVLAAAAQHVEGVPS
jgi:hypothetical protein